MPIGCYGLLTKIINTKNLHNFKFDEICKLVNDRRNITKKNLEILVEMGYLIKNQTKEEFKLNEEKVLANCQITMPFLKLKEV
jgi:hypothetical protein